MTLFKKTFKLLLCICLFSYMPLSMAETAPVVPTTPTPITPTTPTTPDATQSATPMPASPAESADKADDPSSLKAPLPSPVARVVWIKGTQLKAVMPNKEERILQKGSIIYLSDVLITDASTQAEIVFTDNTLMTFQSGTRMIVEKYAYQPQAKSNSVGSYVMNLLEGGFRTITGLIAKANPNDYQINTPVATIGVRGTDFRVGVVCTTNAAKVIQCKTYMALYSGRTTMKNKPANGKEGKAKELSKEKPFAEVDSPDASPELKSELPPEFSDSNMLEITPATINFSNAGSSSSSSSNGAIKNNSFCIG